MIQTTDGLNPDVLHVRFAGRSDELSLQALGVNVGSSDDQIKLALAKHLARPVQDLETYVVVRHRAAIVVRPEAVYG
jgi:hypothetical protein